jgi:hypothetical protein
MMSNLRPVASLMSAACFNNRFFPLIRDAVLTSDPELRRIDVDWRAFDAIPVA